MDGLRRLYYYVLRIELGALECFGWLSDDQGNEQNIWNLICFFFSTTTTKQELRTAHQKVEQGSDSYVTLH